MPNGSAPAPDAAAPDAPAPLFFEQGASWLWLLLGPVCGLAMVFVQYKAGVGFQPMVPLFFLIVVSSVLAVQVRAARLHTSVELTRDALRSGTETVLISEIVEVYPEPEHKAEGNRFTASPLALLRGRTPVIDPESGPHLEKWQSARSLGELSGIPKGRTAIGLKLTKGSVAQAWARNHDELRAQLTALVDARK